MTLTNVEGKSIEELASERAQADGINLSGSIGQIDNLPPKEPEAEKPPQEKVKPEPKETVPVKDEAPEEGEGKPTPEPKEPSPKEKGETLRVKVNGVEKDLPIEEVIKGYQNNEASTKRFQEASDKEKDIQRREQEFNQAQAQLLSIFQEIKSREAEPKKEEPTDYAKELGMSPEDWDIESPAVKLLVKRVFDGEKKIQDESKRAHDYRITQGAQRIKEDFIRVAKERGYSDKNQPLEFFITAGFDSALARDPRYKIEQIFDWFEDSIGLKDRDTFIDMVKSSKHWDSIKATVLEEFKKTREKEPTIPSGKETATAAPVKPPPEKPKDKHFYKAAERAIKDLGINIPKF
ncbi:MAG: hypothetical protein ACFFDT_11490 [Candidatus Hodarchaeota archaeon]